MASAIASTEGKNSRCTGATLVIVATSGSASVERARISPGADMPISSTAAVCSGRRRRRVRGRPYWLLRLPSVLSTGPRVARRCAVMSLVVVLPTEPVTPTTGSAAWRRTWRARSERALVVSATRTRGRPPGAATSRWTRARAAPRAAASATKSCPSNLGPTTATNRAPGSRVRESIETEARASASGARATSAPPVPASTSARVRAASATAVTSFPSPRRGGRGRRGPPAGRRTARCGRAGPGTARGPCPR